ncbi:MAG: translocation/assembly module TamB domain-containing protein [Rikenellaceae bacterium]
MRKVIKILVSIISSLVLVMIILPVLLSLSLQVGVIQNYAARSSAEFLSKKLGAEITLDNIHLKLFNRVSMDGVCFNDFEGDTLIYAKNLSFAITSIDAKNIEINLNYLNLTDAKFYMYETDRGVSNFREILIKLRSDKPKEEKRFTLRSNTVDVKNIRYKFRKINPKQRDYGVNFEDLDVVRANVSVTDMEIIRDSVNLKIKHIDLEDKSGFKVKEFEAKNFIISPSCMIIDRFNFLLQDSRVNADYLTFSSKDWSDYKEFIDKVVMGGSFYESRVSTNDIAYFAPRLKDWNTVYRNFSGKAVGEVRDLKVDLKQADIAKLTQIQADVRMVGLPDVYATDFDVKILGLKTDIKDADTILRSMAPSVMSLTSDSLLLALGDIELMGEFKGRLEKFTTKVDAITGLGDVSVEARMVTDTLPKGRRRLMASFIADSLDLKQITGSKVFGKADLKGDVTLREYNKNLSVDLLSSISKLEFNSYTYSDIHINALKNNDKYQAMIVSGDKNMNFELDANIDFRSTLPNYGFELDLKRADLKTTNIYTKDKVSLLELALKGKGEGLNYQQVNGYVDFEDVTYTNSSDTVSTGKFSLRGENSDDSKFINLDSDFADVRFTSKMGLQQLDAYMSELISDYVPLLVDNSKIEPLDSSIVDDKNNYSLLKVDIKDVNEIVGIFTPGLEIAQGATFMYMANPSNRDFSITFQADYIKKDKFYVGYLNANTSNKLDSLSVYLNADEVYAMGIYMPKFSVVAGARNNKMSLFGGFANEQSNLKARISLDALLREDKNKDTELLVRINNSSFNNKNRLWDISSGDMIYSKSSMQIDDFEIVNNNQRLHIDGLASTSDKDTLQLTLTNFDISPFSSLTEKLGYGFNGRLTGNVDVVSAFKTPNLFADMDLKELKFNEVDAPDSKFVSQWDFARKRARFTFTSQGVDKPVVQGFYSPGDGRYMADIEIDRVDLSLLDPLLKGVLKSSRGNAEASLTLTGQGREAVLNGRIKVDTLQTKVAYTNVDYMTYGSEIEVKDNVFTLKATDVYDVKGNKAVMTMDLRSRYFKNFSFDIGIMPTNLMVLNTTRELNEDFYGTVYGSGGARITGDVLGVNLDIVASTSPGSSFVVPLNGQSSISAADFIVFVKPEDLVADSLKNDKQRHTLASLMSTEKKQSNMNINMTLTVNTNADLYLEMDASAGGSLRGKGNGILNINVNPTTGVFNMYGDYNLTEGIYMFSLQNIINKRFVIQDGSSIVWRGDPLDATIDISAVYKVKASLEPLISSSSSEEDESDDTYSKSVPVDCEIQLMDRLMNPTITFNVAVPSLDAEVQSVVSNALNTQEVMATQFFTLLAFNSFYSDTDSQSLNIGTGGTVTGFEFLSSQLSNWISSDKYNIGIRYRPKGDTTSDELDIGLSTSIIDDRLLLEVEGNFDFGNNTSVDETTTNSITGDFYLTWLLDKAGSIKMKAFTRTMDRFDENQDLQESGIGVYYTENFNKFGDILSNFRNRYKIKKRIKKNKKQQIKQEETNKEE